MGTRLIVFLFVGIHVVTSYNTTRPEFDLNAWWGPSNGKHDNDTSIRPFKIVFENEMLEDLMYRIKNYRFSTNPLEPTFRYGFNVHELKKWRNYWVNKYPFAKRVEHMNKYDHFLTNIQGLDIHFVKVPARPTNKTVLPLLMMHGWASSFLEFYDTIPYIISECDKRDFALEIIVPSLPGFAYSDGAVCAGMGANEIGVVMRNLMHRLGYHEFYIYGGDWGSHVGASMATNFDKEVLGYYTSLGAVFTIKAVTMAAIGQIVPELVVEDSEADRLYPLTTTLSKMLTESGYLHIQSTKPDTIGIALSDSPVGFLAYLLQVISMATRKNNDEKEDGGLLERYTEEQLMDTVMLYWATNTITTSSRIYAETFNKKSFAMMVEEYPTDVPTCVIQAPDEVIYMPFKILATKFTNIQRVIVLDEGGHFLPMEMPKVFADNLVSVIQTFLDYYNNVPDFNRCL